MLYTTNIGDEVVVDFSIGGPPSLHTGRVEMISRRGINVSTPWGHKFVKWHNVKRVTKRTDDKRIRQLEAERDRLQDALKSLRFRPVQCSLCDDNCFKVHVALAAPKGLE
jgi:hypothetical protein